MQKKSFLRVHHKYMIHSTQRSLKKDFHHNVIAWTHSDSDESVDSSSRILNFEASGIQMLSKNFDCFSAANEVNNLANWKEEFRFNKMAVKLVKRVSTHLGPGTLWNFDLLTEC